MKKRIITMLLATTLAISLLGGCGTKEPTPNTETSQDTENTTETLTEVTEETEIVEEVTETTEQTEQTTQTEEPTETPASTYTYIELDKTMYAKQSVNVRSLPSTDGEKLGALSFAQEVHVSGQCNETSWYRIDYNGSVAYVSNNYLVDEKPVAQTTPSTNNDNGGSNGGTTSNSGGDSRYGGYWDVGGSGTYTGATVYTNPTYGTSFTIPAGTTVWGNDRPEIYNSTYPILLAKAHNYSDFGIILCFGKGSTLTESIDIEKQSNTTPLWTCGETYTTTIGGNTYYCFNVVHSDGSQDTIYLFRESAGKILMYKASASAVQYISY